MGRLVPLFSGDSPRFGIVESGREITREFGADMTEKEKAAIARDLPGSFTYETEHSATTEDPPAAGKRATAKADHTGGQS